MKAASEGEGRSLLKSVFGTETLICVVGGACVVGGLADGVKVMPIFFGVCIILGSFLLRVVRKKDWDKHWAEQDRIRRAYEARMAEGKEKKEQR